VLVPFSQLEDRARIWIYPASRKFSAAEKIKLVSSIESFLSNWSAHGTPLKASYEIPYDQFIVIAVDENIQPASGCSIDASVHFIQQLEKEFTLQLLDKMNVCYKQLDKIEYLPLKDFRKLAKTPKINLDTIVFNNLVVDISEYQQLWEVPAYDSWHARFIK
jgi:hypothetical protein